MKRGLVPNAAGGDSVNRHLNWTDNISCSFPLFSLLLSTPTMNLEVNMLSAAKKGTIEGRREEGVASGGVVSQSIS